MDDAEVRSAIEALGRYLLAYPHASDTAAGIANWWMGPGRTVSMESLNRALLRLLEFGVLEQRVGGDGQAFYRRCCSDADLAAALAAVRRAGSRSSH